MRRESNNNQTDRVELWLRGLFFTFERFQAIGAERMGLNETDFRALEILTRFGKMPAGELAQHLDLTSGAVTGVIDRLEASGYACREQDRSDRRRVVVAVTPAAGDRADPVFRAVRDGIEGMIAGYSAEEKVLLQDAASKLAELLNRHAEELKQG
jgi:DNA-binding MarR family transcriptional regulator